MPSVCAACQNIIFLKGRIRKGYQHGIPCRPAGSFIKDALRYAVGAKISTEAVKRIGQTPAGHFDIGFLTAEKRIEQTPAVSGLRRLSETAHRATRPECERENAGRDGSAKAGFP